MKLLSPAVGRVQLTMRSVRCLGQVCVLVTGGRAHFGACSAGCGGKVRTFRRPSHRDDAVTEAFSSRLAAAGLPNLVVGGIHYDRITLNEIETVLHLADAGADAMIKVYKNGHNDGRGERK